MCGCVGVDNNVGVGAGLRVNVGGRYRRTCMCLIVCMYVRVFM